MKKLIKAAAVIAVVISSLALLAGCSRTITVTGREHFLGWYYLCDGSTTGLFGWKVGACRKGHMWQVSRQEYDSARAGQQVTISWP